MQSGAYRQRLYADQLVQTKDAGGGIVKTWQAQFLTHARVRGLTGREILTAAADRLAELDTVIELRRSTNTRRITPQWRLRDVATGKLYDLQSVVLPEDPHGDIRIHAKAGVTSG